MAAVSIVNVRHCTARRVEHGYQQGSKVLNTVRTTVAPTASEYIAKIPTTQEVNNSVVSFWNKGVTATFSTIAHAPEYGKKALGDH